MSEDTGQPGRVTPIGERKEVRKHERALFRGQALVILGFLLLAMFGAITAAVAFLNPLALDVPITREVQEITFGPVDWLLLAVSWPGFQPWNFIFPIAIILVLALVFKRFAEAAFLVLASVAASVAELTKLLIQRGRPSGDLVNVIGNLTSYSFPSGHVTQYTLFFGFSFYLAFTLLKRSIWRTLILIFCAAMIILVGPSRIWMGQHWASDVLGGYTLSFGLLLLIIWGYRAWEARRVEKAGGTLPESLK